MFTTLIYSNKTFTNWIIAPKNYDIYFNIVHFRSSDETNYEKSAGAMNWNRKLVFLSLNGLKCVLLRNSMLWNHVWHGYHDWKFMHFHSPFEMLIYSWLIYVNHLISVYGTCFVSISHKNVRRKMFDGLKLRFKQMEQKVRAIEKKTQLFGVELA